MSLFNTLSTGASGMGASSTNLSVIGDNIANIGTTAYKSSTAGFADNFPNIVLTSFNGVSQVGSGARLSDVALDFGQGTITETTSAIDVAILGAGFFQLANGEQMYYTRDGSFHLDVDSYIVNAQGMRLQGYQSINGTLTSVTGDMVVTPTTSVQKATDTITLTATLSANADFATEPFAAIQAATPLDGTVNAPTFDTLTQAADYSNSVTVFDSLGLPHDLTLFYERTTAAPDTWTVTAVVDGGQVDTNGDGTPDGVTGHAYQIGTGTVQFDTNGVLIANSGITIAAGWTFPNSDPFAPTFEFGLDPAGQPTAGELTMNGTTSFVKSIAQNGYTAGQLDNILVGTDGSVVGNFTNGQQVIIGQVAVALFDSNEGLIRAGGNLFRSSSLSGDAALGVAGSGGRGTTNGYALEASNVELEDQFVAMIKAQRSYQANTGVIRTADEALQQLIQLV